MVRPVAPQSPSRRDRRASPRTPSKSTSSPFCWPAVPRRPTARCSTLPAGVLRVLRTVCDRVRVVRHHRRKRDKQPPGPDDQPDSSSESQPQPASNSVVARAPTQTQGGDMDGLLQCSACDENLNLDRRRPKLLPCGHTLCLACARYAYCGGTLTCPADKQVFHTEPLQLQDDLQLVCWLEATGQGVLECPRCSEAFNGSLRRPAALDCGHTVCRLCLQEGNEAVGDASSDPRPRVPASALLQRRDSAEEFWEYSEDDDGEDTCSSVSSLPSDSSDEGIALTAPVADDALVDCPVEGCLRGVRARDNQHLLQSMAGGKRSWWAGSLSKRAEDDGRRLNAEVLAKLTMLEGHLAKLGTGAVLTTAGAFGASRATRTAREQNGTKFNEADLGALVATMRWLIEHKDSPRSEQPGVLNPLQSSSFVRLSNTREGERAVTRVREDVTRVDSIKECKVELDVYDLCLHGPSEMRVKKEAVLRSEKKVWKLTGVDCWCDPEWALRLLRRVAPDVQELQLRYPGREHLQVVRDCLPHLRRLEVRGWDGQDLLSDHFRFDQDPDRGNTLEWLEVFLPMPTAMSLIRAHRGSLRKVRFVISDEWDTVVADDDDDDDGDEDGVLLDEEHDLCVVPYGRDCLRSRCWTGLLSECVGEDEGAGSALAALSLLWLSPQHHDTWHCRRFARTLAAAKPHLAFDCEVCRRHGVPRTRTA